jgi:hypothetical protein
VRPVALFPLIVAFIHVLSCTVPKPIDRPQDIEGTYKFVICGNNCSMDGSGDVLVQGIVVLQNAQLTREQSASLHKLFRGRELYPDEPVYRGHAPFGCYSLRTIRHNKQCWAGMIPRDFTEWWHDRVSDSTSFLLLRTVDSSYTVSGHFSGGHFEGKGQTSPWTGYISERQTVLAERIGPPDIQHCTNGNALPVK